MRCEKRTNINKKEAGFGPFLKKEKKLYCLCKKNVTSCVCHIQLTSANSKHPVFWSRCLSNPTFGFSWET